MDRAAEKSRLRRLALARRDALSPRDRTNLSAALCGRLLAAAGEWPEGPVAGFWPIRSEVDPRPALTILAGEGRMILLPRVGPQGLSFHRFAFGDPLTRAGFGLSEPLAEASRDEPAIMLVPLAAFDRRGHRIGYGAGYYDRAIAKSAPEMTIGLAFSIQEIEAVPDEAHDRRLDWIVTERETLDLGSN